MILSTLSTVKNSLLVCFERLLSVLANERDKEEMKGSDASYEKTELEIACLVPKL